MKNRLIFSLLILVAVAAKSQEFNSHRMDSLFSMIEKEQQGMGSISIFKNGVEVYQNSFGFRDVNNQLKSNAQTKYRIGSISKTFTSVMIMQLVQEEKLTLDTKLSFYYPKIPNAAEINIEHLLRHRSGLFNFTSSPDYMQYMEIPKTPQELINIFIENGVVFQPDEKYEYSNTNYVLLSFILEKIEGKPFQKSLEDRITKPLQLQHTYYGGKINPENNEAFSYRKNDSWLIARETDMSIPMGAGSIVSTPTDLNVFFNALFNGELIDEKSLEQMKNVDRGYGLGLIQIPFYEQRAYGHNGGIDGFQSNAAFFPGSNVAIAYTTNGVGMSMNDILIGALSIYFGRDYDFPEFQPAIVLESEDLDKYLGIYSSQQLPLKLTITKDNHQLRGQATGQSSFPLEAFKADNFRFTPAGIVIEFLPEKSQLILKQGGGEFEFSLDK